jgi:hypothetical protein
LRLLRLSRLVLLVGYWGRLASDLWTVVSSRERRYQIGLVLVLALVASFVTAILLVELGPGYDYDENGVTDAADLRFAHVLWWSFRQLPDPGNLIARPSHLAVVLASLAMTFAGMLLFSFIIGISAGVMGELMQRARERALGLRGHTALIGLGPCSRLLVEDLLAMYRKNRRPCRLAVLGATAEPPEWLASYRQVVYRSGDPMRADDLARVDISQARRVLVMTESGASADARAVAAVLAIRSCTPHADVFLDVDHEKDFAAARMAGGPRTHVIGAGSLLGYVVAHNAVHPGANRAVRELLSHGGEDLYTYLYDDDELARLRTACRRLEPAALAQAFLRQGVVLLGAFVRDDSQPAQRQECPKVLLNLFDLTSDAAPFFDGGGLRTERVQGFIGIGRQWADVKAAALAFTGGAPATVRLPPAPAAIPVPLAPAQTPRRVLICGTGARLPRVLSELLHHAGSLEAMVLTREPQRVPVVAEELRTALAGRMLPAAGPAAGASEELADGRRLECTLAGGRLSVRILVLDWTDTGHLLRHPAIELQQVDVVLFLPRAPDDVTDGLVAIDCLRIADGFVSGETGFSPDLRVVALLGDPTRTDLLESRLDASAPGQEARFTVLSSERMRQGFAVRNLFVPGLSPVLFELLSAHGQHLQRLVPVWPDGRPADGSFAVQALADHLIQHQRLLPIGFELAGQALPVFAASLFDPGRQLRHADLQAVYVVGRSPAVGGGPR